jgi:DNA ligase-1
MKRLFFLFVLQATLFCAEKPDLIHAIKYTDQNISGWLMSEKLDGVRAVWDGKKFTTRKGNLLTPHRDFIANFPPFPLDGELWTKRRDFETVASIVRDGNDSNRWMRLSYNIFETPHAEGNFNERLQKAKSWFRDHPNPFVRVIPQIPVTSPNALQTFLEKVEAWGGEGVMVRNPHTPYLTGRNPNILKVKSYDDMEGTVIGYKKGKGKYEGQTGALHLKLPDGTRFYLGSGLDDATRRTPPPVGSLVTFKYYGLTGTGKPRFASFLRVRNEP